MSLGKLVLLMGLIALSGCATYTTPGGPVNLTGINSPEIHDLMARDPAAEFPARIAFARVQSANYRSRTAFLYGYGEYSVVTNREFMSDEYVQRMSAMPGVHSVAPVTRLLIPEHLRSIDDLRTAGARLKSDMLVIFTLDTSFRVDGEMVGPLTVLSLGLLRDRETRVDTTASAVFIDVRTGFVYGVAEASASDSRSTNVWNSSAAVDQSRLKTERDAFEGLVEQLELAWQGIVAEHERAQS